MRKQAVQSAAQEVATQLRTVEESIDCAISEIARLQSTMMHARSTARVGPHMGQEALEQVAGALGSLVATRGGIAKVHAYLKGTSQQIPGVREMGFGDATETPPPEGVAPLRVVA